MTFDDEIERRARVTSQSGSPNAALARTSAAIVKPFQSASTLSSRPGLGRASRTANSFAREAASSASSSGEPRGPTRRSTVRPSQLPLARHVVGGLEARRGVAQRGVDLLLPPDIEQAFLAILIGVERGGEGVADPHLAHQPADRLARAIGEYRIGPQRVDQRQQFEDLRVVVEHLLEMRHEPFGVGRIARVAAAEMIVDAARVHRLEHGAHGFAEGRIAAAEHLVPEEAEDRRVGEFRRAARGRRERDRPRSTSASPIAGQVGGRDARAGAQRRRAWPGGRRARGRVAPSARGGVRQAASTDSSTCRNDGRPQRGSGGQ